MAIKHPQLAEASAALGRSNSRNLAALFFFFCFAPVDEGWSAMDESESQNTRRHKASCIRTVVRNSRFGQQEAAIWFGGIIEIAWDDL